MPRKAGKCQGGTKEKSCLGAKKWVRMVSADFPTCLLTCTHIFIKAFLKLSLKNPGLGLEISQAAEHLEALKFNHLVAP